MRNRVEVNGRKRWKANLLEPAFDEVFAALLEEWTGELHGLLLIQLSYVSQPITEDQHSHKHDS